MSYTLRRIQEQIGGELSGNDQETISGVSALETARPGQLSFAEHDKYAPQVRQTHASAVIVSRQFPNIENITLLRVENPRASFVKVMELFQPPAPSRRGIHSSAVIAPTAKLASDVTIGECTVIRDNVRIGRGTIIESGVHIGHEVVIGEDCRIGPNVVIMYGSRLGNRVILHGGTVIGGDGFGYVWIDGHHVKIPQLGNVVIEDDVELGCNVCVDRATFGSTMIRRGTKMDNLVQIAHNDSIGEDVIITGQVGLSGSVTVGNRVMFGGQSGVVDHVTIGDDARIGAATPVTKNIPPGQIVWGFPGRPIQQTKRELASLALLPRVMRTLKELSSSLSRLTTRLQALEHHKTSDSS